MNTQAGSYLDATVPYILENDGYTTKVNGQLMNVDATSSLQFRSFLECETLQVKKEILLCLSLSRIEHMILLCSICLYPCASM